MIASVTNPNDNMVKPAKERRNAMILQVEEAGTGEDGSSVATTAMRITVAKTKTAVAIMVCSFVDVALAFT